MKTAPVVGKGSVLNGEAYTPIGNLEAGQTYEQTFMVGSITYHARMKTTNGKSFARVVLKDVTGEIEGVLWGYDDSLVEGQYAVMKIETKLYRGNIEFQAQLDSVQPLSEPPINQHDYIKGVSDSLLTHYANEVEDAITSIDDEIYRDVLCNAMHKLDLLQALKESPYGLTGPMAYRGGLLVHVVHTLRFGLIANQQARELEMPFSPSLVVTGCILRNIGWHTTTRFQGDYLRPRDAYSIIGVHRASARYIDHLILTCESDLQIEIPESKRQALENMCNIRTEIHTLEGKIVTCANDMADLLDLGIASLQRKQKGNWRDGLFVGHLNG